MQCGKPNYKPIPNVSINGWYKPSPNGRFIDSFLVLPHYSNYPLFIHIHPLLLAIPLLFIHYCSLYHYYLSIIVGYTTIIYPLLLAIPLLFIHYCWLYHYYLSIIVRYTTIIYPLLLAIPLLFIHYCWLYHIHALFIHIHPLLLAIYAHYLPLFWHWLHHINRFRHSWAEEQHESHDGRTSRHKNPPATNVADKNLKQIWHNSKRTTKHRKWSLTN